MSFPRNNRQKRRGPQRDQSRPPQRQKQKPSEKKGSVFDLKSQTGETTEIATSRKTFSFRPQAEKRGGQEAKRRTYRALFFDTFQEALERVEDLKQEGSQCDQLNIVIKAEGDMYRTPLRDYGKVFAGEAWYLIHKRRQDDGWYTEPQE